MARNNKASNYDRSLYQSKIYKAWSNMHTRCGNSKFNEYHRYGGRGIKVCDKWKTFEGFLMDMQDSYRDGLQLDRKDNDGNYELSNCRWATMKEQSRNRSDNRLITINNETKPLADWIDMSGLKSSTFRQRFYCYKWPIENCFKPLMK